MAPPPSSRLKSANYPFIGQVPTRYADLDPQVHINNVAVAALYEEGRGQFLRWLADLGDAPLEPANRLIVEIKIGYLAQVHYPSTLAVNSGIVRIGRTSYVIAQGMFLAERCVGVCETVVVHSDGQRSKEITPAWRRTLERARLIAPDADCPATGELVN